VPVQGWHFVVLDSNNLSVQVKSKLVKLDPGPVLKAYAVDLALKQIRHLGQKGAMVHIGPEMACFGQAPYKRKSWRVGIPQENNNVQNTNLIPDIVFALNDHAVSTSRFDTAITSSKTQADSNGDSNEVTSLSEFSSITVIAHSAFEAAVLNNCIANVGSSRGLEMIENAQAAAVLVGPAPDYVVIKSRNADAYIRIN
jgi:thiamine biosynthesis lipoprotein ApbE